MPTIQLFKIHCLLPTVLSPRDLDNTAQFCACTTADQSWAEAAMSHTDKAKYCERESYKQTVLMKVTKTSAHVLTATDHTMLDAPLVDLANCLAVIELPLLPII